MYHADFEKNIRGSITSVTDDPEMKRVKEVANVISQAAYTRGRSNSENADMEHRIGKSVANYCLAPGAVDPFAGRMARKMIRTRLQFH